MDVSTLERLIGHPVEKAVYSQQGALVLSFSGSPEVLDVPGSWTFTSCLGVTSPSEIRNDKNVSAGLIGLKGAQLTGFQCEENCIDLYFGSITITAELPKSIR